MPVTFHIPGPLRVFTGAKSQVEIEPSSENLRSALEVLWESYPALRHRILNEQGSVRDHVNIFVGEESIRHTAGLDTPLPDGCEISIIPAVSGGSRKNATGDII